MFAHARKAAAGLSPGYCTCKYFGRNECASMWPPGVSLDYLLYYFGLDYLLLRRRIIEPVGSIATPRNVFIGGDSCF